MQTVLVTGKFDILHPGHVRLLKFAKECGQRLVVAVNSDESTNNCCQINEKDRLELVKSLESVDQAFLTSKPASAIIQELQPEVVVKGKEFESVDNPEESALATYGGKLIFGSGEFERATELYFSSRHQIGRSFDFSEISQYAQRHQIDEHSILNTIEKMKRLNVVVIGEVIVDEYVQGSAVGLSQEDPTIVMTPTSKDMFLGGAAITAGHIKAIGANTVTLLSVTGNDEKAQYVKQNIANYKIAHHIFSDNSRPTPLKTRYRVDKKTLLRVNQVRHHKISQELQEAIVNQFNTLAEHTDVMVFSDFNYGVLPQTLVERLMELCRTHSIRVVADSQTSSQVGDISRYKNTLLVTPTEKEVRVALNNSDDGLVILAKKLCDKSTPDNLVITLADEGIFIHIPDYKNDNWVNDRIPAINKNAADPAGAGDCFLATSSLAIAAGASPWQAFYIASIAAACQVDTLGNTPLAKSNLVQAVKESFS
ncbi:ADP-heptose synthase [Thalassotalea euphylliae]|uniref:ADP-heptose synthase n=1 Tax=Thalassotalea euphylliae TaxID=1655234 RepID=A0A3E0TNP7_9GAMM|nr:PfkB family carbohydrate kinase [Thalassotalea euphylliae]REL26053.1 ADP-heptose synthase [Thalassotalea euphylliae]